MDIERAKILLRAAFDLLQRDNNSYYIESANSITVFYDDANCDGSCLKNDIAYLLEIDEDEPPIPLAKE